MKLFLLPAGAYRELIIPNYLESMYLAKLPKSLHPPNNIMRQLKMKLPHDRAGINSRASITDTAICRPYALNADRTLFRDGVDLDIVETPSDCRLFPRKDESRERRQWRQWRRKFPWNLPFPNSVRVRAVPSRR